MTTRTKTVCPEAAGPEAGRQGWLYPATGPCSHTSTVLFSCILGCFTEQGLPRRVLALASTSRHRKAAWTDQYRRMSGKVWWPKQEPRMQRRGFVPSSSSQVSFCSKIWCLTTTLTQLFHLCRTTEHLLLPGVLYVAPWVLFAKELLLHPGTSKAVPAATCL